MLAHARAETTESWVTFIYISESSGDKVTYNREMKTLKELELAALRATRFSRAVRYLVYKLNEADVFPPFQVSD
jgi:type VI protein secretion system component Hcp